MPFDQLSGNRQPKTNPTGSGTALKGAKQILLRNLRHPWASVGHLNAPSSLRLVRRYCDHASLTAGDNRLTCVAH